MHKLVDWKIDTENRFFTVRRLQDWLLKEFAQRHYENTAYFNFDEHPEYAQF